MAERAALFDWEKSTMKAELKLTLAQQDILKQFVAVTKMVQKVFMAWQRADSAVISSIIPAVFSLRHNLQVR